MPSLMIFQPKGAGTEHKEGTIVVQSTISAGTDSYGSNYTIDTYVSNLPATGTINENFKNNNTGCAPCTASCGPC
jgi:hypothetical protein|tara:strand:+ start:296 stop:520 length:225 start_codon:yes stop_codon:yes gene_type:complete